MNLPQTITVTQQNNVEESYILGRIEKGQTAGQPTYRFAPVDFKTTVASLGGEDAAHAILCRVKQAGITRAFNESYDAATGNFEIDEFKATVTGAGSSETEEELRERISAIHAKSSELVLLFGSDQLTKEELLATMNENKGRIASLEEALAKRQELNRMRTERRNATRAANEAAKAAVAA